MNIYLNEKQAKLLFNILDSVEDSMVESPEDPGGKLKQVREIQCKLYKKLVGEPDWNKGIKLKLFEDN